MQNTLKHATLLAKRKNYAMYPLAFHKLNQLKTRTINVISTKYLIKSIETIE